jgi:hypothetical protein
MKPDWIWHLTLNTSDTRKSYRSEVSDDSIESMREMRLLESEARLPFPGYTMKTTIEDKGAVFSVYKDTKPLVLCLLAVDSDDARSWKVIEETYLKTTDKTPVNWALPEKPDSTPWLAVNLLGLHYDPEADHWHWLGDFERCMAWLLIEDAFDV